MTRLNAGQDLPRGASISSDNGRHTLALQEDGNLVLTSDGKVVWASGTNGSGVDRLAMQADGNVVLYAGSDPKWATDSYGNDGAWLELRDDRNLMVHGPDGRALWSSDTAEAAPEPPAPAPTEMGAAAGQTASEQVTPPEAPNAPAPAPKAPAPKAERVYVVEPGDTLSAISLRYYGDAMAYMKIANANNIEDPNLILVGQRLVIPE